MLSLLTINLDCIGVNGGGRRTIIELQNGEIPYGITITENNILWTDWKKYNDQLFMNTIHNIRSI